MNERAPGRADSRDAVLGRIRAAVASSAAPPVPREYGRAGTLEPGSSEVLDLLTERLLDYRAGVVRVETGRLAAELDAVLGDARPVAVPPGLPGVVVQAVGGRALGDEPPLRATDLDAAGAVVTTAAVAIALTGTIILDAGAGQGRRALTLIPDLHVVVLRPEQVVHTVPEALARLDLTRPITMISGPSATSDIELSRVEGVHGPRTLKVLIDGTF